MNPDRKRIIDSASALFRVQGFDATELGEIALEAGLTRADIEGVFPDRDDLVVAVLDAAFDDVIAELTGWIRAQGARDALQSFVRSYLSLDHVRFPDPGCPITTMGVEAARGPAAYRAAILRGRDRVVAELARGFDAPPDTARVKAATLLSTQIGAVILARSEATEAAREATITEALETVLASLQAA